MAYTVGDDEYDDEDLKAVVFKLFQYIFYKSMLKNLVNCFPFIYFRMFRDHLLITVQHNQSEQVMTTSCHRTSRLNLV